MTRACVCLTFALLTSCGPESPPAPTVLVPTGYDARFVEVRGCRSTTEHLADRVGYIRVLTNPEAAAPYRANAATLAAGTTVLKEEYADPSCSQLTQWTVMHKEPGYDATHGDWHWQRVRASDRSIVEDGRVARCFNCHNRPECTARDWMCTEP